MDIDVGSVDHALTTTRAVRLRLDLDRPVDDHTIYDCIGIAVVDGIKAAAQRDPAGEQP